MTTEYTYKSVTLKGQRGFIATRWIDGRHSGKCFGRTKALARSGFAHVDAQ